MKKSEVEFMSSSSSGEGKRKLSDEESGQDTMDENDVPQQFNLSVYLIMLILGLGLLTPWNIVLNA
jgi:hypothetical protein